MSLFNSKLSSAPAPSLPSGSSATGTAVAPTGFTIDQVKGSVPSHMRASVSQSLVDNLNNIANDPLIAEDIRNNFISYSAILKEGRFKLDEYLNAVAYVSYKIMGNNNEEAYAKTFPQRYSALVAKGTDKKTISSYVFGYNKGKLVNMILEQSLVPSWVLNQDIHQKAINRLADLMQNAASEKVQAESAAALLTHLGKPKEGSFQINIGEVESSGMKEMRAMLAELAQNQRSAIADGSHKTIDITSQRITRDEEE